MRCIDFSSKTSQSTRVEDLRSSPSSHQELFSEIVECQVRRIDLFISPFASEALSRYPLGLLELTVTLSYFT